MNKHLYLFLLQIKNYTLWKKYKEFRKKIKYLNNQDIDVCFFIPCYHIGGAEKVHYRIAQAAKQLSLKIAFVFTEKSNSNAYHDNYKELGFCIDLGFRYNNTKLNSWIQEDLVNHLNCNASLPIFTSNCRFFYNLLKKVNSKIVVDLVHSFNPPYEIKNLDFKDVFPKLSHRVFICEQARKEMEYYYLNNLQNYSTSSTLIYNAPFDTNSEPDNLEDKSLIARFNCIHVGRNSPEKRPQIAFEVAKRVSLLFPNEIFFTMIGDFSEYEEEYESSNINIVTNLKDAVEIIPFYKKANALILTSETEGFPMVIAESMFFGVVPITTAVGGIPEIVKDNYNGILINNKEKDIEVIEEMVEKISLIFQNNDQINLISKQAFSTAKEYFSNKNFMNKYTLLFNEFIVQNNL